MYIVGVFSHISVVVRVYIDTAMPKTTQQLYTHQSIDVEEEEIIESDKEELLPPDDHEGKKLAKPLN